jgi:hypothetical protein
MEVLTTCPTCGRENDRASHPDNIVPKAGDISICWLCRGLGVFTGDGMALRKPTEEERMAILQDPEFRATLHAMTESMTPSQAMELMRHGN